MNYLQKLKYHYRPEKGWVNDPNGLVYFQGYYHIFYQYAPDYEVPFKQPMHWGHARTRDFLHWEELPVALFPDKEYDNMGCWSGTAIVKDDRLYLFYSSGITPNDSKVRIPYICIAYSDDGIHFEKYDGNPIIDHYPAQGGPKFGDPAICRIGNTYYCVIATGNSEDKAARLLLYKSDNLLSWNYTGVMSEWADGHCTECPSFMPAGEKYLLTSSVMPLEGRAFFEVMYGDFDGDKFTVEYHAATDKGPDQYAGQVFLDPQGRNILISWVPGWQYSGYVEKDIGCMSVPRELKLIDGVITAYPIEELQTFLKDEDEAVKRTENGFVIERSGREPVIYNGEISDLKILRDGFIVEVFVNGGQEVYTALL